MWCSASSCFLLNGEPEKRIIYCRRVRQGDPLSPMLFMLAMKPLFMLFNKAQELGLLDRVSKGCERFRVSIYADDTAMFIKLTPHDLHVSVAILNLFAEVSGLVTIWIKPASTTSNVSIPTWTFFLKATCQSPPSPTHIWPSSALQKAVQRALPDANSKNC
jgi:hypothetical protein